MGLGRRGKVAVITHLVVVALAAIGATSTAHADTGPFTLRGTVTALGSTTPVPNVTITVTDHTTHALVATAFDSTLDGSYATQVPSGDYDVHFAPDPMAGFRDADVTDVSVSAD